MVTVGKSPTPAQGAAGRRSAGWLAPLLPLLLAAAAVSLGGSAAAAQKPQARKVAPVTGYMSTPTKRPFSDAIARSLTVPAGFEVSVFASGLGAPRMLAVGDDGTVYVTRRDSGDVLALRDGDGDGRADGTPRKVVASLPRVHGIAARGGSLYLATVKEVFVVDARAEGQPAEPRLIIGDLPDGGQHPNRTLDVGPDGMLYISIGSSCNACVETNDEHATILRAKLDGSERGVYARGLRNTVGWGWHPETREMWGMDHGSDWRGNDTPPEELNLIQSSAHYGWPFCYGDKVVDRLLASDPPGATKEDFCPRTAGAMLTYQAHSAPIQMAFYGGSQFPAEYRNDAFVAMRGSWNREPPTGYKVVRVRFENGKPVRLSDFLTGFLSADRQSYSARLAGIAVARDGSLLVSDDTNGAIYRVAYTGKAPTER